jgi:hypothetical protein
MSTTFSPSRGPVIPNTFFRALALDHARERVIPPVPWQAYVATANSYHQNRWSYHAKLQLVARRNAGQRSRIASGDGFFGSLNVTGGRVHDKLG